MPNDATAVLLPDHFARRSMRIVSNAALYDLVSDMARSVDHMRQDITEIKAMLHLLVAREP